MKPRLKRLARPMLTAWAGVSLQETALYGVRVYTRNAWLRQHVDKRTTHVISEIVNVDQEVDEPWPLQIRDHAGG